MDQERKDAYAKIEALQQMNDTLTIQMMNDAVPVAVPVGVPVDVVDDLAAQMEEASLQPEANPVFRTGSNQSDASDVANPFHPQ